MSEEMEHSENKFNSEDQQVNTVTQGDGMYQRLVFGLCFLCYPRKSRSRYP